MPLQKIEIPKQEFTFSDGQSIFLNAPTLLQLQNAQKQSKNDEIEQAKILLIDMSEGELTREFLNSLPISEWLRLSENIGAFMGIDPKN
ncbi:MAG: phage tail assembly protein [Wolinella sp.]